MIRIKDSNMIISEGIDISYLLNYINENEDRIPEGMTIVPHSHGKSIGAKEEKELDGLISVNGGILQGKMFHEVLENTIEEELSKLYGQAQIKDISEEKTADESTIKQGQILHNTDTNQKYVDTNDSTSSNRKFEYWISKESKKLMSKFEQDMMDKLIETKDSNDTEYEEVIDGIDMLYIQKMIDSDIHRILILEEESLDSIIELIEDDTLTDPLVESSTKENFTMSFLFRGKNSIEFTIPRFHKDRYKLIDSIKTT